MTHGIRIEICHMTCMLTSNIWKLRWHVTCDTRHLHWHVTCDIWHLRWHVTYDIYARSRVTKRVMTSEEQVSWLYVFNVIRRKMLVDTCGEFRTVKCCHWRMVKLTLLVSLVSQRVITCHGVYGSPSQAIVLYKIRRSSLLVHCSSFIVSRSSFMVHC